MVSRVGRVQSLYRIGVSCLKRSNATIWTQGVRDLILKIGSHGWSLRTSCAYSFLMCGCGWWMAGRKGMVAVMRDFGSGCLLSYFK